LLVFIGIEGVALTCISTGDDSHLVTETLRHGEKPLEISVVESTDHRSAAGSEWDE